MEKVSVPDTPACRSKYGPNEEPSYLNAAKKGNMNSSQNRQPSTYSRTASMKSATGHASTSRPHGDPQHGAHNSHSGSSSQRECLSERLEPSSQVPARPQATAEGPLEALIRVKGDTETIELMLSLKLEKKIETEARAVAASVTENWREKVMGDDLFLDEIVRKVEDRFTGQLEYIHLSAELRKKIGDFVRNTCKSQQESCKRDIVNDITAKYETGQKELRAQLQQEKQKLDAAMQKRNQTAQRVSELEHTVKTLQSDLQHVLSYVRGQEEAQAAARRERESASLAEEFVMQHPWLQRLARELGWTPRPLAHAAGSQVNVRIVLRNSNAGHLVRFLIYFLYSVCFASDLCVCFGCVL